MFADNYSLHSRGVTESGEKYSNIIRIKIWLYREFIPSCVPIFSLKAISFDSFLFS